MSRSREELQALVADKRYWTDKAYYDYVTDEFRKSYDGGGEMAGGPGLVHVQAYQQVRNGQVVDVAEHQRGAGGSGQNAPSVSKAELPKMQPPVAYPKIRGDDGMGDGVFGANRDEGEKKRSHKGVDIVAKPGEPVFSPVDGKVEVRKPDPTGRVNNGEWIEPYPDDAKKRGKLKGVGIITEEGHRVRLLYVDPDAVDLKPGQKVRAGQAIGEAQDLSTVYIKKMTNHVHVDVQKGGVFIDPTGKVSKW
ncbi:MAG: M23 family metallopeptidase [Alphaproteobacteria bacterium]|nr:M23 family metallopeptidase [Alphaproteobacteria bacterium]